MKPVPLSRALVFFLLAAVGCVVDLVSKSWIFAKLGMPDNHSIWLIDQIFGFTTSLNKGALFGMGQNQVWLFASLSIFAAVGILIWLFCLGAARDWWLTIALACVTAGILGNLYDRLGLPGLHWPQNDPLGQHLKKDPVYAVRDWLHFKIDAIGFNWPIFNIADSLLVCGAIMMIIHSWRTPKPSACPLVEAPASQPSSPPVSPPAPSA